MQDQKLAGYLIAHGALLVIIMNVMRKSDPTLIETVKKEFDTYLGTRVGKNSPLDDKILVEARRELMNMLDSVEAPGPLDFRLPKMQPKTFWQKLFGV